MDPRLIELYVQRGRLRERIGSQRSQVARDSAPRGCQIRLPTYAHNDCPVAARSTRPSICVSGLA